MNRPALGTHLDRIQLTLGVYPSQDWAQILNDAFLSVAPPGQTRVYTAMCGSCANETAYKVSNLDESTDIGCIYLLSS
jgi:hypothetical protein